MSAQDEGGGGRLRPSKLLTEAIVIVGSILLAFGIEASWSERQERAEESEALVSLEAEFAANLVQIDTVIARHVAGRELIEMLVELSEAEIGALDQSTVSEIMLATANPWTFDPVLGTTDALVGAGRLGILRDPGLREALTTFKNFVEDAEEDVAIVQSFAEDVWRAQIPFGGPWADPGTEVSINGVVTIPGFVAPATASDLLRLRSDAEFMGRVAWFHLNAGYYLSELERIRGQIGVVLNLTIGGPD